MIEYPRATKDRDKIVIRKLPCPKPGHIRVVFELPASTWADQVYLVGDFNHWGREPIPLRQERDGVWRVVVELPVDVRYEFRYRIDDRWQSDSQADGHVPNPYGTQNSVLITSLAVRDSIDHRRSSASHRQHRQIGQSDPPMHRTPYSLRPTHSAPPIDSANAPSEPVDSTRSTTK